jgi:hypothetical protein
MTAWWRTPGSTVLTPEVQKMFIDSVHAEVGSRSIAELEAGRDEIPLGLLNSAPGVRRRAPYTKSQLSEVIHERDIGKQSA